MAKKKHTIVQYKSHKKHPVVVKKKKPVFKTALKVMLILLLIAALTILITAWIQVRQESKTELKSETRSTNYIVKKQVTRPVLFIFQVYFISSTNWNLLFISFK